jgi:hypothetical protein
MEHETQYTLFVSSEFYMRNYTQNTFKTTKLQRLYQFKIYYNKEYNPKF